MGNDKDKHADNPRVCIELSSYKIGKYEVTNKEFLDFVKEKGIEDDSNTWLDAKREKDNARIYQENGTWKIEKGYGNHPIVGVTWFGAVAYCEWLSQKTGKNYRLPTEAEWEYAARGGTSYPSYNYSGSNNLNEVGWSANNAKNTYSVGQKKSNTLGIYDMTGNVWEWCSDWYEADYFKQFVNNKSIVRNPQGATSGKGKVIRGSSFREKPSDCRVDYRAYRIRTLRFKDMGFRIVLEE